MKWNRFVAIGADATNFIKLIHGEEYQRSVKVPDNMKSLIVANMKAPEYIIC
jgi:hypothetical protein